MLHNDVLPVTMNGPMAAATLVMTEIPSKMRLNSENDDQIILPLAEVLKQ